MAFSPFRDDTSQVRVDFAHNDYLEFTAEAGAIGVLALLVALLFGLTLRAARAAAAQDEIGLAAGIGLIAVGLHSVTDFHLSIPADALAVAVLLGLFLRQPVPLAAEAGRARAGADSSGPRLALGAVPCPRSGALSLAAARRDVAEERGGDRAVGDVDATPHDSAASPDDDLCPACRLEPFNSTRYVEAAARRRAGSAAGVRVAALTPRHAAG